MKFCATAVLLDLCDHFLWKNIIFKTMNFTVDLFALAPFLSLTCLLPMFRLNSKLILKREVLIVGFHFLQSVLVTIDRHEWYAPPQLYTRNDSSGLWDAKPAIEPASVSSIGNNGLPISQDISLCHHDTEPMHEVNVRGVTDIAAIMEASSGDGSQNDFGSEAKKQRVDDESLDAIASNGSLYGSEFKSDDAMATDSTVLRDFEGATALPANASLAERAIEPALVMFEVKTKTFLKVISFTSC